MQCEVEAAVELVLCEGQVPRYEAVRSLVSVEEPKISAMEPLALDLAGYDALLVTEVGP